MAPVYLACQGLAQPASPELIFFASLSPPNIWVPLSFLHLSTCLAYFLPHRHSLHFVFYPELLRREERDRERERLALRPFLNTSPSSFHLHNWAASLWDFITLVDNSVSKFMVYCSYLYIFTSSFRLYPLWRQRAMLCTACLANSPVAGTEMAQ